MRLTGLVAIVTGAGQGIGSAIAVSFASEGAVVVVVDITLEKARPTAERIGGAQQALAVAADVTQKDQVDAVVTKTLSSFGRIDVLVNNAGISEPSALVDLSEARWDRVIDTNLKGPFLCSQAAAASMIERRAGKIINIASVAGQLAHPTQAAYCASKAGLVMLTKVMAAEWGKYNINVNAISPGAVETERLKRFSREDPDFLKGRLEATPLGRFIQPEEVARLAVFFASPDSSAITGANIPIDGGSSAIWAAAVPALQKA